MKLIKFITAIVLSSSLLFSSIGISVSRHYCMGMLKNVSYYSMAEKCEFETNSCEESNDRILDDFSCCSDQTMIIPGISIVKTEERFIDLFPTFSLPQFLFSKWKNTNPSLFQLKSIGILHPPERLLPTRKILIEIQRFLI